MQQYDTLIIDEAHERSLNIDFLLGYVKRLLPRRPELKLIITSATIDADRFSKHFDDAPAIEVSGRLYPVDVWYRPFDEDDEDEHEIDLPEAIVSAVDEVTARTSSGDVLVFLPGEREIREAAEALRKHHPQGAEILPLFARLSAEEPCRLIAIDAWHHHIHEDEIRLHLLGLLDALGAIGGCSCLKAVALQRNLHHVHFGGRVIHYQYERHAGVRASDRSFAYVGLDRVQQLVLREGLGEVMFRAHDPAARAIKQSVLARQHDDRDRLEDLVVLDERTGLITVESRHHDVNENYIRLWSAILERASNRSTAV